MQKFADETKFSQMIGRHIFLSKYGTGSSYSVIAELMELLFIDLKALQNSLTLN